MRNLLKRIRSIILALLALYYLAALLLLDVYDMGIVRSAALAWEVPWLEKACLWFCMPMIVCTCIGIPGILIHEWIVRRRTRREAKEIVAKLKSHDTPDKKESP